MVHLIQTVVFPTLMHHDPGTSLQKTLNSGYDHNFRDAMVLVRSIIRNLLMAEAMDKIKNRIE